MLSKLIAIDASPNTKSEDLLLALAELITPWGWRNSQPIRKLEDYFIQHYQAKKTLVVGSGRLALYLLLSSVIEPGDEIITQAFTCLAVTNAITWAKGKPVFVDIGKDTYNIDLDDLKCKLTKKTKVVIVQHTFGIPGNLAEIKKICDKNQLVLIEDCAHALGAKYQNQLVGTFGDAAIFSFNQDKVVSGVNGGAIIINNSQLVNKFKEKKITLHNPSFYQIFKALLHPLLWAIATPIYDIFSLGKGIIFFAWKLHVLGNTITDQEQAGQIPNQLFTNLSSPQTKLILQGLNRLEQENLRRSEIAGKYRKGLAKLPIIFPKEANSTEPGYLRFPIQVTDPLKILTTARKYGIILGRWYSKPIFPWTKAAEQCYEIGSCPVAEKVCEQIVNLPTLPRMTDEDVKLVIKAVSEAYANN